MNNEYNNNPYNGTNQQPNMGNNFNQGMNQFGQPIGQPMNTGMNQFGQPANNMYNPQPNNPQQFNQPNNFNSPYTKNNGQNKTKTIGTIAVIAIVIILGVIYLPTLFGKSPKGEWTCDSDTYKTLNFTSNSFTFSGNLYGYNVTMTGKYKISSGSVKPAGKKDGFKYTAYKISDVKTVAGSYSSNITEKNLGFIIGFSSDGKTIHYLSGDSATATSFTCTKK